MVSCKTPSKILQEAMQLPGGARFYKCALQVNPFVYQQDFKNGTQASSYQTEDDYNAAIIRACQEHQIEVIAVTDHNRVQGSVKLSQAARAAGIFVFSGFEAKSKDGVHYLCLFDPDRENDLASILGECGYHPSSDGTSALGNFYSLDLLECIQEKHRGICVAAHALHSCGGLLKVLSGETRQHIWKSKHLLACAIAGNPEDLNGNDYAQKQILLNKDVAHSRQRPIAIINASDVDSPEDLALPRSSCLIKMSKPSVEALRQAFLDPDSRIRLLSTPAPEEHTEFLAMAWESGGFMGETKLRFNENLNVLIGGRGAGKSTVIESLRYVLGLDALGEYAKKAHASIVKSVNVLGAGTKISLLVKSHRPSPCCYTIERTIPNPPVVKSEDGEILNLLPRDIVPGVEIYSQHEISELTKEENKSKITNILKRFIDNSVNTQQQKTTILLELGRSRDKILQLDREIRAIEERLAALPTLEETLKRFIEAGMEDKLKEKSFLIKEQSILGYIKERVEPFYEFYQGLAQSFPIDKAFLSEKALENLPNKMLLEQGNEILSQAEKEFISVLEAMKASLDKTEQKISALQGRWNENRLDAEARYEKVLRELQKEKIPAQEFIDLQAKILALRPFRDKLNNFIVERNSLIKSRTKSLNEWQEIQTIEFRALQAAAKKITKNEKVKNRVKVDVKMAADRSPLERLLREEIGGNLTALMERIKARESFSVVDFVTRCREGKDALMSHYSLPQAASEKLAQASEDLFMKIEEIDLPASTEIKLNTASDGEDEDWHTLEQLSTGQKATAVLLLLLLESEAPLIVDQPEDDLDNRFITDGIVPTMREEKRKRQFIFSTHNANIPVLGDAEMILGLSTNAQDGGAHGRINPEHMASIDAAPIRELVGTILEGGKIAFEMRRERYGF